MALGMNEKLSKLLSFLVGIRDPRAFAVISQRGFTPATLQEGWTLFNAAAGAKLDFTAQKPGLMGDSEANSALNDLDQWENSWFPVVAAALERHHPELHAVVFQNLAQTEGRAVIVSVGTLLTRLSGLKGRPSGEAALKLLESRGLTPKVCEHAQCLLEKLKKQGEATIPALSPQVREEQDKALAAAWAWYVEWSAIARTLFTRGDLLARLGLRKAKRAAKDAGAPGKDTAPVE